MKINKISTYRIRLSAEDVDSIRDKKKPTSATQKLVLKSAHEWSRTITGFLPHAPQACASTNSAT